MNELTLEETAVVVAQLGCYRVQKMPSGVYVADLLVYDIKKSGRGRGMDLHAIRDTARDALAAVAVQAMWLQLKDPRELEPEKPFVLEPGWRNKPPFGDEPGI